MKFSEKLTFICTNFRLIFSQEICNDNSTTDIWICPECDNHCSYWKLETSCVLSRITYLFDNNFTVVFSIFMTIWGKN